jgi:selenide,water dikinase
VHNLFSNVPRDPNVLVGFGTLDDAGVYRLNDHEALVQTVDFITPVVDDPFTYGEIAVANALSDVWAMGGRPITALNVAAFPATLDAGILNAILRGGLSKYLEAGVALLGGHTVDDPEIKYGGSITGLIHPDRVLSNAGARAGDVLVLTKPLGVGVISTGIKQGAASEASMAAAVVSMRTLNKAACEIMLRYEVHACTDVTGFGLIGHLSHMTRESQVTAVLNAVAVPLIFGALDLRRLGIGPGGLERNRAYFGKSVTGESCAEEALVDLLYDPQTSGGLLAAVPGYNAEGFLQELVSCGLPAGIIGEMRHPGDALIQVE